MELEFFYFTIFLAPRKPYKFSAQKIFMGRKKEYTQKDIRGAEALYSWLHKNGEVGKFGRTPDEMAAKSPIRDLEKLERAMSYLKKKKLLVGRHGSYMLTREKRPDDFPEPPPAESTADQAYSRPLAEN